MTKPTAVAVRAVEKIVELHDGRARKHDCPGYDCSTCSLHTDESRLAEIIDAAGVGELVEALEQVSGVWPMPPHCADPGPAGVSGPNDGRMRAIALQEALRVARTALSKHAGRADETQGDK